MYIYIDVCVCIYIYIYIHNMYIDIEIDIHMSTSVFHGARRSACRREAVDCLARHNPIALIH